MYNDLASVASLRQVDGMAGTRGRFHRNTHNFLKRIPKSGLKGVKVAAFDTRFTMSVIEESRVLPFFVRLFGYAAKPISDRLKKKGGELIISPEGFFVEGVEGPLKEGELERAANWAKQIIATQ